MGRRRNKRSMGFDPGIGSLKRKPFRDSTRIGAKKNLPRSHFFSGSTDQDDMWAPWPCELYAKAATGQMFRHYHTRSAGLYWFGRSKLFEKAIKNQPKLDLSYCRVLKTRIANLNSTATETHYRTHGGTDFFYSAKEACERRSCIGSI